MRIAIVLQSNDASDALFLKIIADSYLLYLKSQETLRRPTDVKKNSAKE